MKAIEWRASALCAPFIAVLAWGCSGEDGKEPNGSNTGGVAAACTWSTGCLEGGSATGGTGLGGSSGAGGTPSVGGTGGDPGGTGGNGGASGSGGSSGSSGGSASVSGTSGGGASGSGNGGAASDTGDGSAGTDTGNGGASGNAGTAGIAGTSGGGAGGDPDAGGAAGNGGAAGSSGTTSTGGTPFDGGTGGTSGNGGAAGSAGTTSTGGTSATGGTAGADAGSDADADAAGTSGTGGGSQDAGSEDAALQPFSCSGWTRDTTFPPGMDLTGDIWGSSASDVYVATGTYSTGEIAHYDGANWSLMTLPAVSGTWANMNAIWGSSANDVYAGGGYLPTMGSGRSRLLRSVNQGAWVIDPNFPWSSGEGKVRSIWGADASNIFVMVDYYISSMRDVKIYQKNGGSWVSMTLPAHPSPMQMNHIWGKSATEVYAAGSQLDSGNNPIEGILWKFDGSSWSKITTIPSDVVYLSDVHGTTDIVVVGYYGAPGNYRGVRLVSTDLVSWDRDNSTTVESDSRVWTPYLGACLVGGSVLPHVPGSARASELSLGSWTEQPLDGIAAYISGIVPMPSNQVWLATYGSSGADATVYHGTCQ